MCFDIHISNNWQSNIDFEITQKRSVHHGRRHRLQGLFFLVKGPPGATAHAYREHPFNTPFPLPLSIFRQGLHGTGCVWNRYEIGTDKPCVYTGPGGSGTKQILHLVPNGSTKDDLIWNRTVPVSNRSRVNRVDPYHNGSDPERIWLYRIPCKRSLKLNYLNKVENSSCKVSTPKL